MRFWYFYHNLLNIIFEVDNDRTSLIITSSVKDVLNLSDMK
jgi:hypothetical protein